eukprot:1246145-Amphidinium_carterae.1
MEPTFHSQAVKHLRRAAERTDAGTMCAFHAALGGVLHEACAHEEFQMGDLCIKCGEVTSTTLCMTLRVRLDGLLPAPIERPIIHP